MKIFRSQWLSQVELSLEFYTQLILAQLHLGFILTNNLFRSVLALFLTKSNLVFLFLSVTSGLSISVNSVFPFIKRFLRFTAQKKDFGNDTPTCFRMFLVKCRVVFKVFGPFSFSELASKPSLVKNVPKMWVDHFWSFKNVRYSY